MNETILDQGRLLDNQAPPSPQELQSTEDVSGDLFVRLARDQNVSVEKIERLMALWERGEARKAEAAFNEAMALAQAEIEPVRADSYNPQTRSKYPSYEALDRALRPVYTKHGFGLSFDTGESPDETVLLLCYVTHRAGHSRTYRVLLPSDGKGAKGGDVMTKTHATGSAMSYGQRYLVKLIFNVAVDADDDGNRAGGKVTPPEPDGFEDFWTLVTEAAMKGQKAFDAAWDTGNGAQKTYGREVRRDQYNQLKKTAATAERKPR
jgi:ERF superfamily protein